MVTRIRALWIELRSSLWFVPGLIVLTAIVLAVALISVEPYIEAEALRKFPRLFGASAAGSRSMLATIAGSMITVAGVTFSITIVAVSQASSQYTPRILRNFMRDRANQVVLGVFVGIFTYCLVVLRTIRGEEEVRFIPSLAVLTGLVLVLVGIGFLIFFIHHIADSLQAATILARVSRDTIAAVEALFPQELGEETDEGEERAALQALAETVWRALPAPSTGYLQSVDEDGLLRLAHREDTVIRMERGVGEFVVEGTPLVSAPADWRSSAEAASALRGKFTINSFRTVEQDAAFGVRQIVDVALKALSPGVNDTTTAINCVDHLSAILARLASRRIETPVREHEGRVRVLARGPTFHGLLAAAFDEIRRNAEGNVNIIERMLAALRTVATFTISARRRVALREHVELLVELAERTVPAAHDRARIRERAADLARELDSAPARFAST